MYIHIHMYTCMYAYICIYIQMYICMYAYICIYIHMYFAYVGLSCINASHFSNSFYTCICIYVLIYSITYTLECMHTYIQTHFHKNFFIFLHRHINTYMYARIQMTNLHIHADMHRFVFMCICTYVFYICI